MIPRPPRGAGARALAPLLGALLLAAPAAQGSDLAVNGNARYFGGFGLQVNVSGAGPAYVEDDSPGVERRYRARFYLNANLLTPASGDELELFSAYSAAGTREASVLLGRSGTQNRLRLAVRRDDGTYVETPSGSESVLPREWHVVEIDWRAAASPSSGDGALAVWLDGAPRPGLGGIDNDEGQIGFVRWGAVAGVDAGTSGSLLLDEFDSRRDTYIGALSVFSDVPLAHPLWRYVHALYNGGVTTGCGGSSYCPESSVTRDQMAVFLLRAKEGSVYVPAACTTAPFGDVPAASPYCRWIRELVSRGVTGGCGNNNYCPTSPVTRAQMAVFLLVTQEGPGYAPPACTTAPFGDVPASSPYCRWIRELVSRGVTAGCGGGNYCPDAPVTRGSMSVFLSTTFGLTVPQP
jgi:S-layer homology domain